MAVGSPHWILAAVLCWSQLGASATNTTAQATPQCIVTPTASPAVSSVGLSGRQNLTTGTVVTLTCAGNLGSPSGELQWVRRLRDSTAYVGVLQPAVITETNNADGCSKDGISEIKVTLTARDDKAVYMCGIVLPRQTIQQTNLTDNETMPIVFYPATSFVVQLEQITLTSGSKVSLPCRANSNPAPDHYTWTYNDTTLSVTTETYTTPVLTGEDIHIYRCTASSIVAGTRYNVTRTFHLNVTPHPVTVGSEATTETISTTTRTNEEDPWYKQPQFLALLVLGALLVTVLFISVLICRVSRSCCFKAKGKSVVQVRPSLGANPALEEEKKEEA